MAGILAARYPGFAKRLGNAQGKGEGFNTRDPSVLAQYIT
jgi:hypothetical protein